MRSQGTALGIEFVDIPVPKTQKNPIQFTFLWLEENHWEGKDYTVNMREQGVAAYSGGNSSRKRKLHPQAAVRVA